jgi:hypothetical protein
VLKVIKGMLSSEHALQIIKQMLNMRSNIRRILSQHLKSAHADHALKSNKHMLIMRLKALSAC